MNVSYEWIKKYVDIDVEPKAFADKMTMTGTKTEAFWTEADEICNIVAAKILKIEPHPDADKLTVCSVDAGKPLTIVTGAKNIKQGDVVPVALSGATLPGGKTIQTGKLRGIESQGMMCSVTELGLTENDYPGNDGSGIMILDPGVKPGTDVLALLGLTDTIFEFEITSNRPDCLSVSGLAREAAASFNLPFRFPAPKDVKTSGDVADYLSVTNETPKNCSRYCGAIVTNVRVKPSPEWMRRALRQSGVRPINNIVDITNYVMLEYNQPMHAFDHKHVGGGKIVVRQAKDGEKITTLDDIERRLSSDMMVIADSEKPIAVAGVMGGEFSGIYDDTTTIVLESACFNGMNVRATAKALGMRTEASMRYEKGLDPNNTVPALRRALELVEQLDAGDIVGGFAEASGEIAPLPIIDLQPEKINEFLGTDISTDFMVKTLKQLAFTVTDDLKVTPPGFRRDVEGFADLAEEVARIYGYEDIPSTVMGGVASARPNERQRFERAVTQYAISAGYYEIKTFSFMNPKSLDLLRAPKDSTLRRAVAISNPFGDETSLMRTTTLPAMLAVLARNYKARSETALLFELAPVFVPNADPDIIPEEPKRFTVGAYGENADFFAVKGMLEGLLAVAGIHGAAFRAHSENPSYHPGRCAEIMLGDAVLGVFGEVHPIVCENFELAAGCIAAELDIEAIWAHSDAKKAYAALPKFPAITRDLALVCNTRAQSADIEAEIINACGGLLETINVFDVYVGPGVPEGKKSIAYSLVLRDGQKTLTDADADAVTAAALDNLAKIGVVLRS